MSDERVACVRLPDFALEIALYAAKLSQDAPAVLVAADEDDTPVLAYTSAAARSGLWRQMSLAQANTLCPELQVLVADDDREAEVSSRLMNHLQALTPFVEEYRPGVYLLDASGLGWLYDSEASFARRAIETVQQDSFPVTVGLAGNRFVARVAAQVSETGSFILVPSGGEQNFLSNLEVTLLPLEGETLDKLRYLGIRTIGQASSFRANELVRRFGHDGRLLARLSRGADQAAAAFGSDDNSDSRSSKMELTYPVGHQATVTAYVDRMLGDLLERLAVEDRAALSVIVNLKLDNKEQCEFNLSLDRPTVSTRPFLRQLQHRVEQQRFTSGVTDIAVTIGDVDRRPIAQLTLPDSAGDAAGGDREVVLSYRRLYTPQLRNDVLPERNFHLAPIQRLPGKPPRTNNADDNNGSSRALPYTGRNIAGLRLYQPPREMTVTGEEERLQSLRVDRHHYTVARQSGPWEISGHWWSRGYDRRYYEVITADRRQYLVFYDRHRSRWFVQGIFD